MRIAARSIVLVDGARCRRVGRVYARGCIVAATVNLHLVVVVLVLGVGKGVQTVGGVGAVAAVYARMVEQQQTVVEVAAGVVVNVATTTGLLTRDEVVGADIVGIFRPIGVALVCVDSTCRNIDGATDVRVCSIELHNQSLVAERRRCRGTDVQRLQVVAVGEGVVADGRYVCAEMCLAELHRAEECSIADGRNAMGQIYRREVAILEGHGIDGRNFVGERYGVEVVACAVGASIAKTVGRVAYVEGLRYREGV